MPDQADQLAAALRALIRDHMSRSAAVRDVAIQLAQTILDEASRLTEPAGESKPVPVTKPASTAPESVPTVRATVPLSFGGLSVPVEVQGTEADFAAVARSQADAEPDSPRFDGPVDLDLVVARARLKAESCRHFIVHRAASGNRDLEPANITRLNAMIAQAKSMPECFLWVFWPDAEQPSDDALRTIAACYDALADAAALCDAATSSDSPFTEEETACAFQCFAQASSALRVALRDTWLRKPDHDQDDAHQWLRVNTYTRQVYVPRHMTLDDPADPAESERLSAEIHAISARAAERKDAAKQADAVLNRVRYHAKRFPADGPGESHDCRKINEAFDQLDAMGIRPMDSRMDSIRRLLRLDAFPADCPPGEATVRLATPPAAEAPRAKPVPVAAATPRAWSTRVQEVRALLDGGSIVIIGGEPRQDAVDRITDAFLPARVDWVQLTEHGSGEPMRAPIARPDTRLVLVLIKLTGHLHAEEARSYARQAGKSLVFLPAGYNPEQIAEQVLEQAHQKLGTALDN
jgi:hypothetical protein